MKLSLNTDLVLEPTPAGAFYTVSANSSEPARRLLLNILSERTQPYLDPSRLSLWSGLDRNGSIELVHRLQELGWLAGRETPLSAPEGPLEEVLPSMLEKVSVEGKALLADDQGFYLSTSGIPHETAEALSAASANLGTVYAKNQRLFNNNLGIQEQAWTLANAAGNSRLGFWPLHIGPQRFVLIIQGRPTFNQPEFRDLVWVLSIRYSKQLNPKDETL
ncbi:MAG: hypothetical protein P8101_18745 [Candidatus Thiodiazotropha sp.]|jgi:hypothetical protein